MQPLPADAWFDPSVFFVFSPVFSILTRYRLFVSKPVARIDFRWLGSALPTNPNPDTLVLTVWVFAYPRYVQLLLCPHCIYSALRCGDVSPLLLE